MKIEDSAFAMFGILPEVCIHSLIEDEYSKSYIPREECDCGCREWIESTMRIFQNDPLYRVRRVHRCRHCNEVRMADHIGSDKIRNVSPSRSEGNTN